MTKKAGYYQRVIRRASRKCFSPRPMTIERALCRARERGVDAVSPPWPAPGRAFVIGHPEKQWQRQAPCSSCPTPNASVICSGAPWYSWRKTCTRPDGICLMPRRFWLQRRMRQTRCSHRIGREQSAPGHQEPRLFTGYLCSPRALQRYRFSSAQCGHFRTSWSSASAEAGLLPACGSATAMRRPHALFLHSQPG